MVSIGIGANSGPFVGRWRKEAVAFGIFGMFVKLLS